MSYPSFPDLSRAPSLKDKEETLDPTLRADMDNGMEATRAKFTRRRRQWAVSYDLLTADDKRILDEFQEKTAVYGANIFIFADPYTDPSNPRSLTVRFSKLLSFGDLVWVEDISGVGFRRPCTFELREV